MNKNKKYGLETLSAKELLTISKLLNVKVSSIKESEHMGDYIEIGNYTYRVIKKVDVQKEMIECIEGMGGYSFVLKYIDISFNKIKESLGVGILVKKQLFVKDVIAWINNEYQEYSKDYSSYEKFLKEHLYLEVEDLQSAEKLFESDVMAFCDFSDEKEFTLNAKKYQINEDAINLELCNLLIDYDVLGDYGIKGRFELDESIIYKKDI